MMTIFSFDETIRAEGPGTLAGVDEAGRGPLAGPVVAAAVILKKHDVIPGLRDSKKLSQKQIRSLFMDIVCQAASIGIGVMDAPDVDKYNILNATKKAMITAIEDLSVTPDVILIDAVTLEECALQQRSFIKGDAQSASIAAASVVAKYTRDSLMNHYHRLYPLYGFDRHKGYGTRTHRDMLKKYGPCPIHRRSYSPVAALELPFGDA